MRRQWWQWGGGCIRRWWCAAAAAAVVDGGDGGGGEDSGGSIVVVRVTWCYGGLRWGGSRRRWRRVAASVVGDRVDRAMRIHFYKVLGSPEFGRKSGRRR
ncbi:hypothetical protein Tco_0810549 [Tanacetum coccineum]